MEHCADIRSTACLTEVSAFPDVSELSRRRALEPGPSKVSEELLHSTFLSTFARHFLMENGEKTEKTRKPLPHTPWLVSRCPKHGAQRGGRR